MRATWILVALIATGAGGVAGAQGGIRRDTLDVAGVDTMVDWAARATGLPALRSPTPLTGTRELRIMALPSGMVWEPFRMLRLVESKGRISGALYLYWYIPRDSLGRPTVARHLGPKCEVPSTSSGWVSCELPSWQISWTAVADSLQRLGIWSLLTRHGANHRPAQEMTDGEGVLVEGVQFGRYGSAYAYTPERLRDSTGTILNAVGKMIRGLVSPR